MIDFCSPRQQLAVFAFFDRSPWVKKSMQKLGHMVYNIWEAQ